MKVVKGTCTHKGIRDKIYYGKGHVEVSLPNLRITTIENSELNHDSYKVDLLDEPSPGNYIFNKELFQKIKVVNSSFKQFINS